ncbi:PASTA domain-containing protein [Pseudonocardia thermophila]|uniref:PASTA domain-containing protein n=1 Tax=Pseudonocardia thermophila TaxID=1848 RepID=A0A1M6PEN6_PSETH|nr:PASTA domain-containing protein [Pseudonocardia thermophila]SHK06381.1 PASTA domain-containing protein [Pseudonocardia thermophila]
MGADRLRAARRAWKRLGTWMGDAVVQPGSRDREPDPLEALADVGEVRRLLDEVELRAVRSARLRGRSWAEIATRLGVTRQSAWEKWRDLDESPSAPDAPAAEPDVAMTWSVSEKRLGRRRGTTVPNVVGLSLEIARRRLETNRLVPGSGDRETPLGMAPAGSVVTAQSPESGAVVPPGATVLLWLDRGEGGVREPRRPKPEPLVGRKYLPDPADEAVG